MNSTETINALRFVLNGSYSCGTTKIFPTFCADVAGNDRNLPREAGARIEDLAIRCFRDLGLSCDRTRKNLYGYPGLLRDLNQPPPWIEVTMDDVDGATSAERDEELQPLYLWVSQYNKKQIYDHYRRRLAELYMAPGLRRLDDPGFERFAELELEQFAEEIELARCLGAENFPNVLASVLDPYCEFTTAVGAPDLLVWSEEHNLWFFAEVKGPGDSLKPSQVAWLRANWTTIGGHFVLVVLHEDHETDG